jgi:4-diphosphocytidyl-2-C-methyl-D-erythritol kinase
MTSMTQSRRVPSPAKVNLCLLIRGKRPDGYHLLESLVAPITLYDELNIEFTPTDGTTSIEVVSDNTAAPGGTANLAHKAAKAIIEATARQANVRITLHKEIPVGSGLGGGSGNAATVLRTINEFLGTPLTRAELMDLGLKLGADVPLFINGSPAIMEGIGEKLTPVQLPKPLDLVICSDGNPLATKDVFGRLDLSLTSGNRPSNILRFVGGDAPLAELLHNDLEAPAAELHPDLLVLKDRLQKAGAIGSLMTGSGSAVFGVCANHEIAEKIAAAMVRDGYWARPVKTCGEDLAIDGR